MTLAITSLAIAAAPGSAAGKVFGIHEPTSPALAPSVASRLSDLGAQSHRWNLEWQWVEPRPPQNGIHVYNFSGPDKFYAADVAEGIRPLIVLKSAPKWAWGAGTPRSDQPFGMPPGAEHLNDWAAFAAAAARRYPKALGFEIWNEPDSWAYWGRGVVPIDPGAYTAVLAHAHGAIKSVNSSIPVVGGALAAYPSAEPGVHASIDGFIDGMMRSGAAKHMDGFSFHDYAGGPQPPDPSDWAFTPNMVRNALARNGVSLPLWINESGVSTTGSGAVSDQGQAQGLADLYRWFQTQPDVEGLFVHRLYEHGAPLMDKELGFGLMRKDLWGGWIAKPAFHALRNAIRGQAPASSSPPPDLLGDLVRMLSGPG